MRLALVLGGAAVALVLCVPRAWAGNAVKRHRIDLDDLEVVALQHPHAARLLEQGESLVQGGQWRRAGDVFRQARAEAPHSALIARRYCQTLTVLGPRSEALKACDEMLRAGGSPLEQRALVGALMFGADRPTTDAVAQAKTLADNIVRRIPTQPWGYAANCDIAARIGDQRMFMHCVEDLERVAPGHYETVRAEAALAAQLGNWRWTLGLGWLAVGLVFVLALGQAVRRLMAFGGARRKAQATAAAMAALLGLLGTEAEAAEPASSASQSTVADAPHPSQRLSSFPLDENDPEKTVPTNEQRDRNPLHFGYWIMDAADIAGAAFKAKDYAKAVKFYRAIAKAVPDRSVAFSKICECYEAMHDREQALKWCSATLLLPGVTLGDYERYAKLALAKRGALTPDDVKDLEEVVTHLRKDGSKGTKLLAQRIECELGAHNSDVKRLEICVGALTKVDAKGTQTTYFKWALAVSKKDWSQAKQLLKSAEQNKMDPERLNGMRRVTDAAGVGRFKALLRDWRFAAAGTVLLLVGASLAFGGKVRKRRTLARA